LDFILTLIDFFIHLDVHLGEILERYGSWTYLLIFLTIFCETGLVVTPFLPGDSLIFVLGAFAAVGWMDIRLLFLLLAVAAIGGNTLNYHIGRQVGPAVFVRDYRLLKRKYLDQTQAYFEKYGGKTIIIARFLPIVRTFAPFLAGVGRMAYPRYQFYNTAGSLMWVSLFLFAGYYFGNIPMVKRNLTIVILAIVVISVLPTLIEIIRRRLSKSGVSKSS